MRVVEPGHIYELQQLDGNGEPLRLVFVNREDGDEHEGTQTQEVLRMCIDMIECLIDRTNHCDDCIRWEGNDHIIKNMSEAQRRLRLAILGHEARKLERDMEKERIQVEDIPIAKDGHFVTAGGSND